MQIEQIVVVANSRKMGARCLAGVDLVEQRLLRPVSRSGSGALSDEECRVEGRTPKLLEVVRFSHVGGQRDPAQPENVVIDGTPWESDGVVETERALEVMLSICAEGPMLFDNVGRAVPEHVAARGVGSSLALVAPEGLSFGHGQPTGTHPGSARALFSLRGQEWNLPVTDFEIGPKVLQLPEGIYGWPDLQLDRPTHVLLTVSLGGAYESWRHKLVAGIVRFE